MKFFVDVNVMPHAELLDPQGRTVEANLPNVGLTGISKMRIGKHIEFQLEAESEEKAMEVADEACKKLLVNIIMESYEISLRPIG